MFESATESFSGKAKGGYLICSASPANYAWCVEHVQEVLPPSYEPDAAELLDFPCLSGLIGKSGQAYALVIRAGTQLLTLRASGHLELFHLSEQDVLPLPTLVAGGIFSSVVLQGGRASAWVIDPTGLSFRAAEHRKTDGQTDL